MDDFIDRVRVLADEVLFPAAPEVDLAGTVPESHWAALADAGMYGLAAPPAVGGPGLDFATIVEVLEVMAGACFATTFTWIQHHSVVMSLAGTSNTDLRDRLLADLAAGRVRAGVAFAGVIPDPPRVTARRVDGGWCVTGDAPFVSGWGVIDVLQVSAGDVVTGDVIAAVIPADDARDGFTKVTPMSLMAADATRTVSLRLDDLFVSDDEVATRVPRADFLANQAFGARLNGSLPIGIARRCARLLDDAARPGAAASILADVGAVRVQLDAGLADPDALVRARAEASQLALRAAGAVLTASGGNGLLRAHHAQRLLREAGFTLVAASRPQIKAAIVEGLAVERLPPA